MSFKNNFVTKKKLKEMLAETSARNYDLANTNKILKNYIRYLKNKNKRENIGCYFCQDKVTWWHDFGMGNIRVNFCPRCGRKIFTEDD